MPASAKQRAVAAARRTGLLPLFEAGRFALAALSAREGNLNYLKRHPDFAPPPLRHMHDMYAHASYERYMRTGAQTAGAVAALIDKYAQSPAPRVADWGCGMARVLRHLPSRYEKTGFDYNAAAIGWCQEHIPGAEFHRNGLEPPLPANNGAFDVLFALSVFTHLSERSHGAWIDETRRVLAPNGVFLGAFHGAPEKGQLLPRERAEFDKGRLVVRGGVKEGARIYTAFHPTSYVTETLLSGFEILEGPARFFGQTLFVARRR